jgi:hypothetical protein
VTYEEVIAVLENRYGDHHLEEALHAQLKRRAQRVGESLQEFSAVIEHLAHHAHVELPEHCISKEATRAFADRIRAINKTTATLEVQEDTQRGPRDGGNRYSSCNAPPPQGLAHDNQEVPEEPVPHNRMKRLPTAYVLVLWEHLRPSKRLPPRIGCPIKIVVSM